MNVDDKTQLEAMKTEIVNVVNKDIALAISSFKVWLMATVLSNIVLIGIPALFVFFTTQNTSSMAYDLARENRERLDSRAVWIDQTTQRLNRIEDALSRDHGFDPEPTPVRPR